MPRRFPIVQFPNPPLILALAAAAAARNSHGHTRHAARLVSGAGLVVWSYQEVTNRANWFRRLLGLGGAAHALGTLTGR